jgi:hypothetical protein
MMWLTELLSIFGVPQFVSTPIYFDAGMLALAGMFVWLIADLIVEEMDQRRMERSEQWFRTVVQLLRRP